MIYKQLYFSNNLKSVNITAYGKNGNTQLPDAQPTNDHIDIASESRLRLQLQEMEESNARLEKLIAQRSQKLSELLAANFSLLSLITNNQQSPSGNLLKSLDIFQKNAAVNSQQDIEKHNHTATESSHKTLRIMKNLTLCDTLETNTKRLNPVKINLHELFHDQIEHFRTVADHKLITLNHPGAYEMSITADYEMAKTILGNLLNNAIEYSGIGGEITLGAAVRDKFVEIEVQDNGIRNSENGIKSIFHPDSMLQAKVGDNTHGEGMSLLLCQQLLWKHGGLIWIDSKPGKGCKIKFTMPLYMKTTSRWAD
jgi:signal transduction histidine kinase